MNTKFLKANKVSKRYSDKVGYSIHLLKDVTISIEENEFTTILAPIGSGKTSLLKILSGLDDITSDQIITNIEKRIFIPSHPSSFPWLNVLQNISFNSKYDRKKIIEIIALVGLAGYEDHYPNNKSEGFRFRISLGRALANNPGCIILDEPFNNLNSVTLKEIYDLVRFVHKKSSIPFILGTTNITEAIYLSDTVYLMKKNPGEIIEKINIELNSNRKLSDINNAEFNSTRSKIENIFKEKAHRQLYNFSI